jgi:peptide/nickel transport system permease protein
LLPQATALALALGEILSGAVLVEVVFAYPGIGSVLYTAIKDFDYFLIQGIVFTVVVSIAFATLVVDLVYPLIDPRITYRRA